MHPHHLSETRPRRPNLRRKLKTWHALTGFGIVSGALLIAAVALFVYLFSLLATTPATVIVDGEVRQLHTRASSVQDLLTDMNIVLSEGDVLSVDPNSPIEDNITVSIQRARSVTIAVDGDTRTFRTSLTNPVDILTAASVTVRSDDKVLLDGTLTDPLYLHEWQVPVNHIRIHRAVGITIVDGETQMELRTAAETVGEALFDAGVDLYLADSVSPPMDGRLTEGMTISVERASIASVLVDGKTIETRTAGASVHDLLDDAAVTLMGLDYTIPPEDAPLRPGITVRVIRVTEAVLSERELIPFENTNQPEPSLELDQIRLLEPGRNGIRQTDTRIRYENGSEVSRRTEETVVIREPQDRVLAYGTGIALRTVETEAGVREYWRKVRLYATSYHPAALGGDDITATGRKLTKGVVGIDPTLIPYGTEVYVPGYGIGVAADTGAPRSSKRWIDLGYSDDDFEHWARYVDVYILTPVPDNIQYVLPD